MPGCGYTDGGEVRFDPIVRDEKILLTDGEGVRWPKCEKKKNSSSPMEDGSALSQSMGIPGSCRWNRGPLWPRCEEHQYSGPPKEGWVCWGLKVEGTPGYGFVDGRGAALWSKNVGNVKVRVRGYKRGPLWSRC